VLKQLRVIFVLDAIVLGFVLLLALSSDSLLAKAICSTLFLAAVAGAIYVVRYPVPSSVTLALMHTPVAVLLLLVGGGGIGGMLIIGLAVLLWLTVPMTMRTRQIMALHPDLWAARAMRGEKRAPGRIGRKRQEEVRRQRKRNLLGVLLFGVLPLAVLIAGSQFIGKNGGQEKESAGSQRPTEPLTSTALRFREAWNASQHDDVKIFLADSERDRVSRLLDKSWSRKGWNETLPRVSTPELIEHNEWQWYAHYPIDDYGVMKTSWEWENTAWVLVRIRFKKDE
jgi:hypothetical protein